MGGCGEPSLKDNAFILNPVLTTERRQVFVLPVDWEYLRSWRQVMYGKDPNRLGRDSDVDSDGDSDDEW